MSYRVNVQTRNGSTTWGVIHETWEAGERKDRRIPKDQLLAHGFRPDMPPDEARAWAKQLNAKSKVEKEADQKKRGALKRAQRADRIKSAYLPKEDCQEFEQSTLFRRFARNDPDSLRYRKSLSHWQYVQAMLAELTEKCLAREPASWADDAIDFYNYFASKRTSPEYVSKIIRILNLWGHFYCRKHSKPFLPVACPRGHDKSHIEDAYYRAKGKGKASEPLTPAMLEAAKTKLIVPGQYEWLYVSVWFGLRPKEIDGLADTSTWEIYRDRKEGVDVLRLYQGKLVNVARDRRFKAIPVIYPEQKEALKLIKAGGLKRPLAKTLLKVFEGHVTLYGGRKNFTDMMLDHGQPAEYVALWLGHKSLDTTMRHYQDRNVVRFSKPGKAA